MSIKYKIALLFTFLVTIILSVVSLSVYFFSFEERDNTFNTRLKNRALTTARVYAGIQDGNLTLLRRIDAAAVASLYKKSITILGYSNRLEYVFSDDFKDSLFLTDKIIERTKIEDEYYFDYKKKKAVAIHYLDSLNNFIVSVAAFDFDGQEYLRQLKKILLIAVLLAAVLSFFAGLIFAGNLIKPIKKITSEVTLITSNNLSQRIEVNSAKNELSKLAETFNDLLDRLQDSFAIQRRFISNASHELSTPLTSISSQLEVTMQKHRTDDEYREVMKSVYEDIRELQLLTKSLLDIAKAGSQGGIDLTEVRLDEILFKVAYDVQQRNPGFKVILNFENFPEDEKQLNVFGNSNLLYIALKNVIENGCKYSDNNQSVITGIFTKEIIQLQVSNNGDVIAEADIQNIFQPFFRTASAHAKPGFGLGLTLTKRILALHKSRLLVESSPQSGTIFTIEIPVVPSKV